MYLHYTLHSHSSLIPSSPSSLFDVFSQCPDEMRIDALIWDGPSSNSPLYSSVYYSYSSVCQTCCNRSQEEMALCLWMSPPKNKKKKQHQMMQSNKYCFSYGNTFNVEISMITFDMSQLVQSLKHFQPFQLQLVHDESLLWSFY